MCSPDALAKGKGAEALNGGESTLVEQGCAGMSESEKKQFVAPL
ncbi:MAG: hypothetical protein ACE5I0_05520 [Candidatus Binatia bacterium]